MVRNSWSPLTHINDESDIMQTPLRRYLHTPVTNSRLTIPQPTSHYPERRKRRQHLRMLCKPCAVGPHKRFLRKRGLARGTLRSPVASPWTKEPSCPLDARPGLSALEPTKWPSCPLETRPGVFAPLDHDQGFALEPPAGYAPGPLRGGSEPRSREFLPEPTAQREIMLRGQWANSVGSHRHPAPSWTSARRSMRRSAGRKEGADGWQ